MMHTFSYRSAIDGGALAKYNVNSTFLGSEFTVLVAHSTTSGSLPRGYISVLVVIALGRGYNRTRYFVATLKNPGPAPRAAQSGSVFSVSLAVRRLPSAVTTSTESRLKHEIPH